MVLERLRNLLFWRRERSFRENENQVEDHTPFNPDVLYDFDPPFNFAIPENIFHEVRQGPHGQVVSVAQCGPGSIIMMRNDSDRPLVRGDLLVPTEEGGVRAATFEEIENIAAQETVLVSMDYAENQGGVIHTQVRQGVINLAQEVENMINEIPVPQFQTGGLVTKNKYDEKYPHVCYQCKQPLQYRHALEKAREQNFTLEQFKKMWKSQVVEFYCCVCYEKKTSSRSSLSAIERVHEQFARQFRREWGIIPLWPDRHRPQRIHRLLRIIGENHELLYQEAELQPRIAFTRDFLREPPNPPIIQRQPAPIHFHIYLRGRGNAHCSASTQRTIFSEPPAEYREISIAREFPECESSEKLSFIARIYLNYFERTRTIYMGRIPENSLIHIFISRILDNPDYTGNYYEGLVQEFTTAYEQMLRDDEMFVYQDHRERVLWRGMNPDSGRINRVTLYGGIVNGNRISATAEADNDELVNGINCFVNYHPEITNQEFLQELAQYEFEQRRTEQGVRGPRADRIIADNPFEQEYELNPIPRDIEPFSVERQLQRILNIPNLERHFRERRHNFEPIDRNGEMLCCVCRYSPVEIDQINRFFETRDHVALSGGIRWLGGI